MQIKTLASVCSLLLTLVATSVSGQTTNNLKLWLKADAITTNAPSSPVSFWPDSSGNGYNGFCNVAANRPTFITNGLNGLPVIRFTDNGSSSTANPNLRWIQSPLPFNATTNPFTAIVVYQAQMAGARDTLIHQNGGYPILYCQTNASGSTNLTCNASAQLISNSVPYVAGTWEIAAVVEDATTLSLYKNGVLVASTPLNAAQIATSVGNWVIGAQASLKGNGLNGDIAEVLVYNAALTGSQLAATESYLATKYNLSQIVLADNFNTSADPGGINDDLNLRQSGILAPTSYITGGGPVNISGGQISLVNSSPSGNYDFYYATPYVSVLPFEPGAVLDISFDMINLHADNINNQIDSWASFSLSQYTTPGGPVTDWGLLIRTNGTGAVFGSPGGSISVTPTNRYHFQLSIANGNVHLIINGVDQGTSTILCPLTYQQSYMSFGLGSVNNGADSVSFDNLLVTQTLIPLPSVPSAIKFFDAFNSANSTNLNANLARQSGSVAPVTYSLTGSTNATHYVSGGVLLISNAPAGGVSIGMVSPNADFRQFEHLNSFRLKFTVAGTNDSVSNDSWLGVRFRDNIPSQFVASADGGGTGINFYPGDGRWTLFQSVLGASNTVTFPASGTVGVASNYNFEIDIRTNVLRFKINGVMQSLGCGDGAYYLPPSQTGSFLTLQCYAQSPATTAFASFDNLSFESLDPGFTVASPVISAPAYSSVSNSPAFRFTFNSSNSIFYAVDAKSNLTSPKWNYIGGMVGNGGLIGYTNASATNNPQFYRVRVP